MFFALKTEKVVQYYHATPPPSPIHRMKWCNGHGSWVMGQLCDGSLGLWVKKDDPFPSLIQLAVNHTSFAHILTTAMFGSVPCVIVSLHTFFHNIISNDDHSSFSLYDSYCRKTSNTSRVSSTNRVTRVSSWCQLLTLIILFLE